MFDSKTECSFDDNLANFRCNIGILIDSLSGASCNLHKQVSSFIWFDVYVVSCLHKSQSYYFIREKGMNNCLAVVWC